MKNTITIVTAALAITLLYISSLVFGAMPKSSPVRTTPFVSATLTAVPVGKPVVLEIPSLHIKADIEEVGMDSKGRMEVPSTNMSVAWYKLGFKPGQEGSAVIDGHYDTNTGAPAVFYEIGKLNKGDKVLVTDKQNITYTFEVTDIQIYPYDQLPMKKIFASGGTSTLNLITCQGTFDEKAANYSHRTVVYTKRAN